VYFSLIHQRTRRTSNKDIEQGHIISSESKTYRATLVTIVKKYWRLATETKILHFDSISNCTPSDTSGTSPSNDRLQFSNAAPLQRNLRHMPLRIAPLSTSLPFKLPSRSLTTSIIHFKVSRIDNGIDIKTLSLIVARRTRAAAVALS